MKVVFTDYQYESIDQEKKLCKAAGLEIFEYQEKSPEKLIPLVKDADAVVTQYSDINRTVIESMQNCKMIIKYGIGVNNIDVGAASEKGIYVCNVPDYGVEEVSDHAVAMMLALYRKLPINANALKEGEWGYARIEPIHRFSESTVGLVGFGRIPQMVARKLAGFGVKILTYDPYVSMEVAAALRVEPVEFDVLCRECDYVSIHCPLTTETEHLFNRETFKKMKSTACLINTARGPVIDEKALVEALKNLEIAGAAIDVFENEPVEKTNELLQMQQVIATPHCAWYSVEAMTALQRKVGEEVVNVLQGNQPFNCVNQLQIFGAEKK